MILEVCIASAQDAIAAQRGGAGRLELNLGLELGGLTPSIGLFKAVKSVTDLPILPMLRPCPGGFHYNQIEKEIILADGEAFLEAGADGLVFGCLDDRQEVDVNFTKTLVSLCGDKESVFHRAIDVTSDPLSEAEKLADLGVTRILTSGGGTTAADGAEVIQKMQQVLGDRIEILPASGIRSSNVAELIKKTGVKQVHGSCGETFQNPSGPVAPPECRRTDESEVRRMVQAINEI